METTTPPQGACAAAGRGCGTATGWRNKGRCRYCRRAHNAETARYRPGALTAEDHRTLIAALNSGATPEEAAAIVNRTLASILRSASGSGELRAALDGESLAAQYRARQGDYLVSLLQNRRDTDALSYSSLSNWRREDPLFRDAEAAVKAFLADQGPWDPRSRINRAMMEQFVAAIEAGASQQEAAVLCGVSVSGLRICIRTHAPDLNRRLEAVPTFRPGRRRTKVNLDLLRELWHQPDMTVEEIARRLGVSMTLVTRRAADLRLPHRRAIRGRRTRPEGES